MNRWISVLLALLLIVAPAAAQTRAAVEIVPDDALGFILVKNLEQLSGKVERLARQLGAKEHFSLLDQIEKQMGIKKGLDRKGSAVLIVPRTNKEKEFPKVVLALPASDYRQLAVQFGVKDGRDKISEGTIASPDVGTLAGVSEGKGTKDDGKRPKTKVLIARKGAFALLARLEDRPALERILDAKASLAASVQPAQAWLDENDISGVCTDKVFEMGLGLGLAVMNRYLAAGSDTQQQMQHLKAALPVSKRT